MNLASEKVMLNLWVVIARLKNQNIMNITEDAKKRVEWLDKRIILSEQQKEYIEFQIKEAVTNALRKGQSLLIDSVSKSFYCETEKETGKQTDCLKQCSYCRCK
jgi:hypothetical protein